MLTKWQEYIIEFKLSDNFNTESASLLLGALESDFPQEYEDINAATDLLLDYSEIMESMREQLASSVQHTYNIAFKNAVNANIKYNLEIIKETLGDRHQDLEESQGDYLADLQRQWVVDHE